MRRATTALAVATLAAAGIANVVAPAQVEAQRTADVAAAHKPNAPGNPMLAADPTQAPHDRPQWLRSRRTPSRYRSLRKSTGTHKQNRRRLLAGRG